jgi:hypothetical protein
VRLRVRPDGSTELAEVFAKSRDGSRATAMALCVMRANCFESSRQEGLQNSGFGEGGLALSSVFPYNTFKHYGANV